MDNYEIEILELKEELGVDLLPKYLTLNQQHRLVQAMIRDIQEEETKLANNS